MRVGRYADASRANEASIAADRAYSRRSMRSARTASATSPTTITSCSRPPRWRAGAARRSLPRTPRIRPPAGRRRATAAPASCSSTRCCRCSRACASGSGGRCSRTRCRRTAPEPYPRAIWHYARGTAYAKTGRLPEARAELARLDAIAADPALARVKVKNINAAAALVQIARLTLQADIAAAEGRIADAVPLLEQAVAIEDALVYDEPHLWLAPTRHALGAALLAAGRYDDAQRVYREDLAPLPGQRLVARRPRRGATPRRTSGRGARRRWRRRATRGAAPTFRCPARALTRGSPRSAVAAPARCGASTAHPRPQRAPDTFALPLSPYS